MAARVSDEIIEAERVGPRRRAYPVGELVYQLAMLASAVGILVLSFTMRLEKGLVYWPGAVIAMPESCLSRMWWGVDCPGCGLTRSFLSMSRGEWSEAWHMNPAGPLAYAFAWAQIPFRGWQLSRMARGQAPFFSVWLFAPLVVLWFALVGQWWFRGGGGG